MGIRNDAKEIQRLSAIADREQAAPLVQITAARKLLRFTNFSERSCRVAKRVANRWLTPENVPQSTRNRAALLLNFTPRTQDRYVRGAGRTRGSDRIRIFAGTTRFSKEIVGGAKHRLGRSARPSEIH